MGAQAKIFVTGRSQAVRLPKEFRFEGEAVFIRRDPVSGDVVLSRRPPDWQGFFDLFDPEEPVPADFLSPEERQQAPQPERDPFAL